MKRTLSFILALVLLIGLVPMQAFATETTDKTETTELSHKHEYVNGVCEKCVYSYPMDSVEKLEGTIAIYNNTYLIAKGYYGAVIALVNLDFNAVSITRNPDANLMGYAFLKELPTTGQVPSYAGGYTEVIWDEAAEAELKIPDDAAYLYIYYNSNDIVYLPASVVFKNVEQTENKEDEKVEEKEENVVGGATIKVATWNIGHFSGGGISSKVTDAQFDKAVGAFKEYIYEDLDADLLAVNEYSAMFTSTKRAEDSLFTDFASTHFEGQQYNYSCNAMFSNWPVQNLQAYTFECNQNAVIGHTSAIKASDYYYLRGEILLDGTVVTVVAAHLGFDLTKTPDTVCVNQITELLESLADCERVILLGDWNVLDFAYFNRFVDAGYTLGNADSTKHTYAYSHPNRSLDNIIVKGLEIADFQIHETTLSDHYAVTATIRLSSEDESHNHSYESVVTTPTCTEQGYTTYTCNCGDSYADDYVDATGEHSYENGTCTACGHTNGPVITQQPESVEQEIGKKFAITVKAEGEGLTYQWYYKDAGMKNFAKSSNKTASYAYTMQTYMHNRQVYCVITDSNGNSVQTETATITRPPQALKILEQPKDAQQEIGQKFSISPKVEGEGLTYQWYVKESGAKAFKVSSNKTSSYAYTMQKYMIGRQVYCVITDKYGNSVITDVATISLPPVELKILTQPTDVSASLGEKFSISFEVQGDGLTYQWYVKESGAKTFKVSSNKTFAYAYAMQSYMNGRQVYCVITDKYGNQVVTEVVTIHVEK